MTPRPASPPPSSDPVGIEQVEAALVEHYPRLVRLAYLVLPSSAGRHRRVLAAHAVAQRALPRGRNVTAAPAPARPPAPERTPDPGYACLRLRVLRAALEADRPWRIGRWRVRRRPVVPPPLPRVLGLRLSPRPGGPDERALDQALSAVPAAARAAYALRALEELADEDVRRLLAAAGVADPGAALAAADRIEFPAGSRDRALDRSLLESAEFDPCSLQVRPTDPVRRRRYLRAAAVAGTALAVCAVLLGLPDDGWGPDGAAAPADARNPAAERALDPDRLLRVGSRMWRRSARTDFSVWPARGELTGDTGLLRRALAVWARPGPQVRVSATPGTPVGPAAGPAHLLYAGEVDGGSMVVLYDGLRVVRYAEPTGARKGPVALDFARTDGADAASAALVVSRSGGNARYLLAPWVTDASVVDLLDPADEGQPVERSDRGVTDPVAGPRLTGSSCGTWPALLLSADGDDAPAVAAEPFLLTDLGELSPVRLTHGAPRGSTDGAAAEGTDGYADGYTDGDSEGLSAGEPGSPARTVLARLACQLPTLAGRGVRAVNTWQFAAQWLPEGAGRARWVCVRADTWRGTGSRILVHFQAPADEPDTPGAVTTRAENSPACGDREARVLSGVLWKAPSDDWYLLAAGSAQVGSITVTGELTHSETGRTLAVAAQEDTRARISAELVDGGRLDALH